MKIIFNQNCLEKEKLEINYTQKSFFSGEFVKAFCWFFQNKILLWEDTYFQLMASMRKMRMKIPINYTPEMFEQKMLLLIKENDISTGRLQITIYKSNEEKDLPFIIELLPYHDFFHADLNEIDIYRENYIYPSLTSTIHIFNPLNVIGEQYAKENDLKDIIILNHEKRIARTLYGNIFLIQDQTIYSPSTEEGAIISAMKKNFIEFLRKKTNFIYKEEAISPFQTQSSNEIFILSDKEGMMGVHKIRKTIFKNEVNKELAKKFIGYSLEISK